MIGIADSCPQCGWSTAELETDPEAIDEMVNWSGLITGETIRWSCRLCGTTYEFLAPSRLRRFNQSGMIASCSK